MLSHWRKIAIAGVASLVVVLGVGSGLNWFGSGGQRPMLATVAPLPPLPRSSTIVMPVEIDLVPLTQDARRNIEGEVAEFRKNE
jgi:hypothetical protein